MRGGDNDFLALSLGNLSVIAGEILAVNAALQ